jgi:hypothetical protein
VTALYSLALLVSAALLFLLEPMVGKFVLPKLGSTPEVWTTTVLFFQVALLAGYAYAHVTSRLTPRRQALLQLGLLAVAAVVLPIGVPGGRPPDTDPPIPWLLGTLATTAGLPFFALAANGPMLQRWLASTKHKAARDPYFLFAASNGGSLLGLLLYPLLVERELTLDGQGELWAAGYGAAAIVVAISAVALFKAEPSPEHSRADSETAPSAGGRRSDPDVVRARTTRDRAAETGPAAWRPRLRWLALAAVPSSYMLGTTSYLTRDLSPVPLLWVIPLAIYLATLIVAFAPGIDADRLTFWCRRLLPGVAILVGYTIAIGAQRPLWVLVALHLVGLAVVGLLCHARLAADRPGAERLTEYYLWVALGGALGGAFNALVAPVAFPGLVEYPLALVAACLLRPRPPKTRPDLLEFFFRDPRPTRWMDYVAPVLLGAAVAIVLIAVQEDDGSVPLEVRSAIVGLSVGLAVNLSRRPLRFGLALGAIMLAATIGTNAGEEVLERDRSFFGIYRVIETNDGRLHELYDGTTLHGAERIEPGRPEPLTYYNRAGPVGQVMRARHAPRRVAGIGLGAGALACYTRPGDGLTFYEIDPVVARIARDSELFSYLSDCGDPPVVIGDGRLSLERARERYDLIVVDAFNSDAIPVHLITREAIELYLDRLRTDRGELLFNVSNRYADLEPVLANAARELGLACQIQRHVPTDAQRERGYSASEWALLTAGEGVLPLWRTCGDDRSLATWTDDYSNLLSVVDWS